MLHHNGTRDVAIAGRVGARYYLHASAPGKVLLAYAGETMRLLTSTPAALRAVDLV